MNDEAPQLQKGWVVVLAAYLVLLNVILIYLMVKVWPGAGDMEGQAPVALLWGGRMQLALSPERRLLLIVVVAGALGSYIHLATSFADYAGNRQLVSSWVWWYVLRPFIGTALALIVYFVVRGGLISGSIGAGGLSPYGVAAVAGMTGMFSKQATDKLREVFEDLFRTARPPERANKLEK